MMLEVGLDRPATVVTRLVSRVDRANIRQLPSDSIAVNLTRGSANQVRGIGELTPVSHGACSYGSGAEITGYLSGCHACFKQDHTGNHTDHLNSFGKARLRTFSWARS